MIEEDLFHEARAKSTPQERAAFLDAACAGQPKLRAVVESLLAAHDRPDCLLDMPAVERPGSDLHTRVTERPGTAIGPYNLLEQIGEGGFGVVFMAEQQQPMRRMVALKIVKPGMDSRQVVARFDAERQALALMDHPGIARVFDGGETDSGRPYFVMELVRGIPITDFCDQNHLNVRARLELFIGVCEAVQHAHQKGVIHRDLKPSNIMVTMHDQVPVAKVIDFGIHKAMGQPLTDKTLSTNFAQMIGTPMYMSPEQAQMSGLDIDTRTDIYALGVLLYELLTGTTPFDKDRLLTATFDEIRRIIREEEPPKPSTRLSTLGQAASTISMNRQSDPKELRHLFLSELDWVAMKALEKDRNRRYESAGAFAADVRRYLNDQTVLACPPTLRYRMQKFGRRYKGPVLVGSFVLLTLVLGIIGTTTGMIRAERQRVRAASAEADAITQRDKAVAAADAERLAKESAQRRLDQLERGHEILGLIFRDLNPHAEEKEGKPLRALLGERLDDAVKQLEGEAVGDPLAVARLQRTLGLSLLGLGHPEKAIDLFVQARDTFAAYHGVDKSDTLKTMNCLATAYREAQKLELALPLLQETLGLIQVTLGPDHPDTFSCRNNLAMAYRDIGQLNLAIPMFEETLALAMEKLGQDHTETILTMNSLALAYRYAGKLDLGLPLSAEALELAKAKFGPDHSFTLSIMSNLASAYRSAVKLELALPLLEEAFKLRKDTLGADHPSTLNSMNNLALGYREAGKLDLALPLLEEALKLSRLRLSPDHPTILAAINNLALGYQAVEKIDLAVPFFEEALKLVTAKLGPEHPNTLITMHNLATAYRAGGNVQQALVHSQQAAIGIERRSFDHEYASRIIGHLCQCHEQLRQFEEAEIWRRKWLVVTKQKSGTESAPHAAALHALGSNLVEQKKWLEAETMLRETLAIRQRLEPDAWTTFNTLSLLGNILLGRQQYAEAETLLVKGFEGMTERQSKISKEGRGHLTDALNRLVQLYDAWGKPDEAAKWRMELQR